MLIGFLPKPLAEAAKDESGDVLKTTKQHLVDTYGKLPLSFEANMGQTSSQVKFLSRGQGYTLFLTRRAEAVLVLRASAPQRSPARPAETFLGVANPHPRATPPSVLRMRLVGVKLNPEVEGLGEFRGKANYFIGNDPKKWRTKVPMYAKVKVHDVYPGVDLLYYGNQQQLEYDFIVAPGADPSSITMAIAGAERLSLDAQGDLVLAIRDKEIRFQKPTVYQEVDGDRREIASSYLLKSAHQVSFQVATHDRSRPLVIDPVLSYSTYLGGSGFDQGLGIAVDSGGHAYVTGQTNSSNFPTTPGTTQTTPPGGGSDAFVTKLNPAGSGQDYSTYLGGFGNQQGLAIAVDSGGHAYVTGFTGSSFFPTTMGAFQTTFGGGFDAFVTKLNPTGSGLDYSTYLGGNAGDQGSGIAVDALGNAYVTGITNSGNSFPTTFGAFLTTPPANFSAFVTKLNPTGTAPLVYSTFLGGSGGFNQGLGIAVDSGGNAYVTGLTFSSNFPTTTGAFQSSAPLPPGNGHAFVTKLNPTGSGQVYSTYLGGSSFDQGLGIAVDSGGYAYVTGQTNSSNFPTTPGAFQSTAPLPPGNGDAFVTKLNPTGSEQVYSTYLGGSGPDQGSGIAVDSAGSAFVTGLTSSINFPTTLNAIQLISGGGGDAFVTALNPQGTVLVYSSYLGGSGADQGFGIALDPSFSAYITGSTNSINFPTTPGAFQSTAPLPPGNGDAFVTKIADITCTPKPGEVDVEGDGDEQGNDGHKGHFHFCKHSGEMDFDEPDTGEKMRGHMDAVTVSGNTAIISGAGTRLDGTPIHYTAVVLGNAPVIGANHFAISWITATGSSFNTSGALIDGNIVVK